MSNNADLGVILATPELLMVTTTVIIQPRPWLCLLSTPSPRLSGWWQMPPPPLPTWLNCLQNISLCYTLHFTLCSSCSGTSRTAQCTFYTFKGHYGSSSPLSISSAVLTPGISIFPTLLRSTDLSINFCLPC